LRALFSCYIGVRVFIIATDHVSVRQVLSGARQRKKEEGDHREIYRNGLLIDHDTQVVSSLPSSPPNRIVFIALNLQLPLSLEAAERTSPREAENLKSTSVQDSTVETAQRKEALRRIRKRRKRLAEKLKEAATLATCHLSRAPRAAERGSA